LFLPLSNDQFTRGKNNGTTTIFLINKGSVGVAAVMCRAAVSITTVP
jgi:hypothetical protein